MTLTIVAAIRAAAGQTDLVQAELVKLVAPTRQEADCLQYDLQSDNEDPAHFLFYETRESRTLWQAHMNAPHLAAYMSATEGAVDAFTVSEMEHVA